jgi:phosphatidate phosphatase PAH1
VLDIDGTLTPKVLDVHSVRPDAAKAMSAISEKGYTVVYVTTRIPLFQSMLPKWLRDNGFPEGILHVAQTDEERDHPEEYKARVLNDYVRKGWRLEYAYGDSSTDFAAYAAAGIPKERVFALKRTGSNNCEQGIYEACLDGWTEHLPYINTVIATKR